MGPRSSISGELPIDSYFSSAGRPAGPSGSKENRSLKRKSALNALGGDADPPTKKPKTRTPSKGFQTTSESKTDPTQSKEFRVSSASTTTSMPTPNSITKQPRKPLVHVPVDVDAISIPSSSPTQMAPFSARVTAQNTSGGFGLPTPQTVSQARSRADSASQSRSVAQSGSSDLSLCPQTPSRSNTKIDNDLTTRAFRTTPNSQRIVPSSQSQYFTDEQTSSASLDPFLLPHARDHDCRSEEALPSLFKPPPYPLSRVSTASSHSLPFASYGCSSRLRSQNSQIVPTSQFDEVELRFSSDKQVLPPVRSPQAKHDKNASFLKRLELGPPQNPSPRSRDKVMQESLEHIRHTPPHPPPSPLTPLTPSSPREDMECEKMSLLESDGPPLQHTTDKAHEVPSIPPSPKPADETQLGKAAPLSKLDVPAEDPTSDEDENFVVHPSPVRQRSLFHNSSPPASRTPSTSASTRRRHLRISHAKLRSLPAATVELDSDGEEMSSPDTNIGTFPSSPGASCPASSYLDLDGTLPSEVQDFLDMVGTNASSDI